MGLIKEPKDVDFVTQSEPLTKEEKEGLSKFIRACKLKHPVKKLSKRQSTKRNRKNKTLRQTIN